MNVWIVIWNNISSFILSLLSYLFLGPLVNDLSIRFVLYLFDIIKLRKRRSCNDSKETIFHTIMWKKYRCVKGHIIFIVFCFKNAITFSLVCDNTTHLHLINYVAIRISKYLVLCAIKHNYHSFYFDMN